MVGAMSITYTKPSRRLVAERSSSGSTPGARMPDTARPEPRRGDAGLTTNTASCAGSTSASMRPTSSSVRCRAACFWTRAWSSVRNSVYRSARSRSDPSTSTTPPVRHASEKAR